MDVLEHEENRSRPGQRPQERQDPAEYARLRNQCLGILASGSDDVREDIRQLTPRAGIQPDQR